MSQSARVRAGEPLASHMNARLERRRADECFASATWRAGVRFLRRVRRRGPVRAQRRSNIAASRRRRLRRHAPGAVAALPTRRRRVVPACCYRRRRRPAGAGYAVLSNSAALLRWWSWRRARNAAPATRRGCFPTSASQPAPSRPGFTVLQTRRGHRVAITGHRGRRRGERDTPRAIAGIGPRRRAA